jgi:hypothetical protein
MSPFISSVKVLRKRDDGSTGIISVCVLSAVLILYIVFTHWANAKVKAKQEEMKAIAEQVEVFRKV